VRASGRRAEPVADGWRLFGLKIHARDIALEADLEMHFVPSGYVGLCRLAGGEVNICGLFRSHAAVPNLAQRWRDWLGGPAASVLHSRLAGARFDEDSFCSVAGLGLRPRRAAQRHECCLGDALTMIAPVTGNGMSMAFESAELATEPLAKFSRGDLTWAEARREIAWRCDQRFTPRLRWAAWLQWALFQPHTRSVLMFLAARSEWFWHGIFERTR
jgi:menaquinone-9 beta-reductase